MRKLSLLLFTVITLFSGWTSAHESDFKDQPFIMGMIRPESQLFGKWQRLVYSELFGRLGIEVVFRQLPAKRATEYAIEGKIDGEPARPHKYAKSHPVMIRIEEPVFAVNFTAFSTKPLSANINDWSSMAQFPDYFVEYRRGIHICETNLPKYVNEKRLSAINTTSQGLHKLEAGRTDLFIDEETGVLTLLNTPELEDSGIRAAGVVVSIPAYMYIHESHAELADKISATVKQMKEEGVISSYRNQLDREFGVIGSTITPDASSERALAGD